MNGYKHTPGPWAIEQCGENTIKVFKPHDKKRGRIATIKTRAPEWMQLSEADARLMASAPELLDALIELVKTHSAAASFKQIVAARSAIAKAKGE